MSPPLGCKTCPVICAEASLARNKKLGAISSDVALRCSGGLSVSSSSSPKVFYVSGVATGPGATAFTRIPLGLACRANDLVNDTMAPLVAE